MRLPFSPGTQADTPFSGEGVHWQALIFAEIARNLILLMLAPTTNMDFQTRSERIRPLGL